MSEAVEDEAPGASLRDLMAPWLSPLTRGEGLRGGFTLEEWETEQGVTLLFTSGDRRLVVELEQADASRPCFATTARFNVYYEAIGRGGRDLSEDERSVLAAVVTLLRTREGELPKHSVATATRRITVRTIEADRALVYEGPGSYYLNPFVGCMLACPFCYAIHRADFTRSLEGSPEAAWGRWVDVKENLPAVLAREVKTRRPGTVRMSPIITDPYQPIERRYRVTRGCLEALSGTAFVPVLLTRSSLVLRDRDILARCESPMVGVSVTTDDASVLAAFEPQTEPADARIATLKALSEAGITTFAVVQPMLPLDPARFVERVAPWVRAVRIGPMFERQRTSAIYAELGKRQCATEAWERETFEELSRLFASRGVLVNPTDPPWAVLR